MRKYDFNSYCDKRNQLKTEMMSWIKRKARQATGLETERGTQSLAQTIGTKGVMAGKDAATSGASLLGATAKVAAHVATGNVIGVAVSAFDWIKHAAGFGKGMAGMTKAAMNVNRIEKHKESLKAHFVSDGIDEADAEKIVEAIFEVKIEHVEQVPLTLWNPVTADFLQRLGTGYDDIQSKTFAFVLHEHMMKWMQKYQDHADELRDAMMSLLQQKKQNAATLSDPEVQQTLAATSPDAHGDKPHESQPSKINPEQYKLQSNVPYLKVGDKVIVQSASDLKPGVVTGSDEKGIKVELDSYRVYHKEKGLEEKDGSEVHVARGIPLEALYGNGTPYGIFRRFTKGDVVYDNADNRERRGVVAADTYTGLYIKWDDANQVWGAGYHQAVPEEFHNQGFRSKG